MRFSGKGGWGNGVVRGCEFYLVSMSIDFLVLLCLDYGPVWFCFLSMWGAVISGWGHVWSSVVEDGRVV